VLDVFHDVFRLLFQLFQPLLRGIADAEQEICGWYTNSRCSRVFGTVIEGACVEQAVGEIQVVMLIVIFVMTII
jgi:hypothetical protein